MTTFDSHKNLIATAVDAAPSPSTSGTVIGVTAGTGNNFPAVPFNLTVYPPLVVPNNTNSEIIRVINRVGDTLTVVRAQESSAAIAIAAGYVLALTITARTLTDIEAAVNTVETDLAAVQTDISDLTGYMTIGAGPTATLNYTTTLNGDLTNSSNNLLWDNAVGKLTITASPDNIATVGDAADATFTPTDANWLTNEQTTKKFQLWAYRDVVHGTNSYRIYSENVTESNELGNGGYGYFISISPVANATGYVVREVYSNTYTITTNTTLTFGGPFVSNYGSPIYGSATFYNLDNYTGDPVVNPKTFTYPVLDIANLAINGDLLAIQPQAIVFGTAESALSCSAALLYDADIQQLNIAKTGFVETPSLLVTGYGDGGYSNYNILEVAAPDGRKVVTVGSTNGISSAAPGLVYLWGNAAEDVTLGEVMALNRASEFADKRVAGIQFMQALSGSAHFGVRMGGRGATGLANVWLGSSGGATIGHTYAINRTEGPEDGLLVYGQTRIGTNYSTSSKLQVEDATNPQLMLSSSASVYMTVRVDSAAIATFDVTAIPGTLAGTTPYFAFNAMINAPRGEISYINETGKVITIAVASSDTGASAHFAVDPPTTINALSFTFPSNATIGYNYLTSNGGTNDGKLFYTGTARRMFKVSATVSFTANTAGDRFVFCIAKGTTGLSASRVLVQPPDNTNTYTACLQTTVALLTNEYVQLRVANITASRGCTIKSMNLIMIGQ